LDDAIKPTYSSKIAMTAAWAATWTPAWIISETIIIDFDEGPCVWREQHDIQDNE
jgi:hypothetical protein